VVKLDLSTSSQQAVAESCCRACYVNDTADTAVLVNTSSFLYFLNAKGEVRSLLNLSNSASCSNLLI